jgi:hypothetical protein
MLKWLVVLLLNFWLPVVILPECELLTHIAANTVAIQCERDYQPICIYSSLILSNCEHVYRIYDFTAECDPYSFKCMAAHGFLAWRDRAFVAQDYIRHYIATMPGPLTLGRGIIIAYDMLWAKTTVCSDAQLLEERAEQVAVN